MKKRIRSFGYAGKGIRMVFGSEANMKIHIAISIFVILMGFLFHISASEWIMCLLCMGLVMSMEMMNTAIETIVDFVSPEFHSMAGKAKDIAAGAVLICAITSVVVGLLIFLPKVWCIAQCFILK